MEKKAFLIAAFAMSLSSCGIPVTDTSFHSEIRPPAAPLVTVDPYFSIWSNTDGLNASQTVHWTGTEHPLSGAVRVDGVSYRVMGAETPRYTAILPTIAYEQWNAKYLIDEKPSGDWTSPDYDDSSWKTGEGAFGSDGMPGVKTRWAREGSDIWVRRTFEVDKNINLDDLVLEYSHDDVFELYVNGIKVADTGNAWRSNVKISLPDEVGETLETGHVTIAAHCHNTVGGAYVDFGLFRKEEGGNLGKAAVQKSLKVLPTRTIYTFECGGVEVDVIFTAPLFMDDLHMLSRPVNYMTYQVRSADSKEHDVQVYFDASAMIAVNTPLQSVVSSEKSISGISYVRTGTAEQNILGTKGDNVRIDWGYFYLASPDGKGKVSLGDGHDLKNGFSDSGVLPEGPSDLSTESILKDNLTLAYSRDLGTVGTEKVSDYVLLAYDDIYSIQYFGENLRPYWNNDGKNDIISELRSAAADYGKIIRKCEQFDKDLMDRASDCGGKQYSELCALAYRQAIAAHKLVESPQGDLLWLSKENFSNGSIGTVDVTYPSAPLFLVYNPELVKGMMNQIFYYSESGKWDKPFAAHDVGTYPLANGQTYGGDMPVEECGNMLILSAAVAKVEGNSEYARKHWDVLTEWVGYLKEYGLDPENQLCTDDFAGHFAHNANLSVKAIMGIASYGMLAGMNGDTSVAEEYTELARTMARQWKEMAEDGDHYKLTFDKPGTWSQKYNLVWDNILGLEIFDPEIRETELAFYKTRQNTYGLPLDSRRTYTKTDWIIWTASLSPDKDVFCEFVAPVYRFMNETVDRVPMSDWIYTDSPRQVGFQARSVVGGYFIRMLEDSIRNK